MSTAQLMAEIRKLEDAVLQLESSRKTLGTKLKIYVENHKAGSNAELQEKYSKMKKLLISLHCKQLADNVQKTPNK